MPAEMLQTSSSSAPSKDAHATAANNKKRQERSCKGKRYQEMINENKLAKRAKSNSVSGGSESGGESGGGSGSKAATGSKWVSGGFDLEEHIAALPQLGDAHLMSALSHMKKGKQPILNGATNKSSPRSDAEESQDAPLPPVVVKSEEPETNGKVAEPAKSVVPSVDLLRAKEVEACDGLAALAEVALSQANALRVSPQPPPPQPVAAGTDSNTAS